MRAQRIDLLTFACYRYVVLLAYSYLCSLITGEHFLTQVRGPRSL